MNIEIVEIKNKGIHAEERIVLKALSDLDLSYYFIVHTKYLNEGKNIDISMRKTKWFVSKLLKANDLVVIYTKKGTYSSKINGDGSTSHFYYWDIDTPLFNTIDDCAVVFEIKSWSTSKRI